MNWIALFFDHRPSYTWQALCFTMPALLVLLSWWLIRWKRKSVLFLAAIALLSGYSIVSPYRKDALFQSLAGFPYPQYLSAAGWFSASVPLLAIALFFFADRKRPSIRFEVRQ